MAKSKATYLKVAETAKKKADWHWSQAKIAEKDGDETKASYHYRLAESNYATAQRARESAENAVD
jgi:hypothetical protein